MRTGQITCYKSGQIKNSQQFRIVAIAQFGFFGYHGLVNWSTQWATFVWSAAVFIMCEGAAIWFLEDRNGTD